MKFFDAPLPMDASRIQRVSSTVTAEGVDITISEDDPNALPVHDDSGFRSDTKMLKAMNAHNKAFWAREAERSQR